MNSKGPFIGIVSFLIVLFTMPLGHAGMILAEHVMGEEYIFLFAFILGLLGAFLLLVGMSMRSHVKATVLGLFAGLFVWTGWVEFAYVYYARRYEVQPLIENGEVVTKPEYLIMPSSIGFLAIFLIYYFLGTKTGCVFFTWFQKKLKIKGIVELQQRPRNIAMVTFNELILILWTFYLVLLFSYDNNFLGDRHPATYIIAFGSLLLSLYLFIKLIKIQEIGYAIRYAIPTVIIFWNFVEIMGRWNVLKEIWVEPSKYYVEISLMLVVFIILTVIVFTKNKRKRREAEHM